MSWLNLKRAEKINCKRNKVEFFFKNYFILFYRKVNKHIVVSIYTLGKLKYCNMCRFLLIL